MTRTHIARKLLEHGPLTRREFREITGWNDQQVHSTLQALEKSGAIDISGPLRKRLYALV